MRSFNINTIKKDHMLLVVTQSPSLGAPMFLYLLHIAHMFTEVGAWDTVQIYQFYLNPPAYTNAE